jgi:DNA primase
VKTRIGLDSNLKLGGQMARVSEVELERMKAEISLEALVKRSGVELRKVGNDLHGRCPFHDDAEPSLVVTPAKNLWHCLGECQTGGSVIDWVMRAQGVTIGPDPG